MGDRRRRRELAILLMSSTWLAAGAAAGGAPPATAATADSFPVLKGPYLGQPLPGDEPQVFAPGILSTGM